MNFLTAYYGHIAAIRLAFGASDTMLHMQPGLAIYLVAKFLLRTRRASR